MIRQDKNAITLTTDSQGNSAIKVTKTNDKNLYINFPSSSSEYLNKPDNESFSLLMDNVEFPISQYTPIHSSQVNVFTDNGYYGYRSNDWTSDGMTHTVTANNTTITRSGNSTGYFTYRKSLYGDNNRTISFNYFYDSTSNNQYQGFKLFNGATTILNKSWADLNITTTGMHSIKIIIKCPDTIVVYVDNTYTIFNSLTIPSKFDFQFWVSQNAMSFNRFHIDTTFALVSENSNDDVDYIVKYSNNTSELQYPIYRTKGVSYATWTAEADGEIIPSDEEYFLVDQDFELSMKLHEVTGDCGILLYSKKFSTHRKYKFSTIGVPSNGGHLLVKYDGNKIVFKVNETVYNIPLNKDKYFNLESNLCVGFYMKDDSSFKYSHLRIGNPYEEHSDAGFIATNNPNWYRSPNTAFEVNDTKTAISPLFVGGTALAYPTNNQAKPLFLKGNCEITFNYFNDGGDGSNKCIELINSLENYKNTIYISDLFPNPNYQKRLKYEGLKAEIDAYKDCISWINAQGTSETTAKVGLAKVGLAKVGTEGGGSASTTEPVGLVISGTKVKSYTNNTTYQEYDLMQDEEENLFIPQEAIDHLNPSYRRFSDNVASVTKTNGTTFLNALVTEGILDNTYVVIPSIANAERTYEVSDAEVKVSVTNGVVKAFRKVNNTYTEYYSKAIAFDSSDEYYFRLKQKERNGKFYFNNLNITNDVYKYTFAVKCRGFDANGKIHRNNQYEVGVWEQVKTATVYTDTKRAKVTFDNAPSNVKYVDFEIILSNNIPSIIFSNLMLYEGSSDMNYQKDSTQEVYNSATISFLRNFYANLYNEVDSAGISVIRPYMDSIGLTSIPKSETTVFYPYMKKSAEVDSPARVSIEYLRAINQIINVDWL